VKFYCKYCRIQWSIIDFEKIEEIQSTQCYITLKGVNHLLVAAIGSESP